MDINDVFGQPVVVQKEETYKAPAISPFDFINAINFDKKALIVDDWSEKQYIPYIVNRGLSFGADTVIPANEMNSRPHLDRKLQFDFLINTIRPRKRYNKWVKADKVEAIELVKTYYGYSIEKARQALSILTSEQLDHLKQKLEKGGL
jgi:hypothetical protein